VRVLHEKDVIRNALRGLSNSPSYPSVRAVSVAASGIIGRMLHVRVCSARAVVDLADAEAAAGCTFQVSLTPFRPHLLLCSPTPSPPPPPSLSTCSCIAASTVSADAAALAFITSHFYVTDNRPSPKPQTPNPKP
jgi:hypothetical protein